MTLSALFCQSIFLPKITDFLWHRFFHWSTIVRPFVWLYITLFSWPLITGLKHLSGDPQLILKVNIGQLVPWITGTILFLLGWTTGTTYFCQGRHLVGLPSTFARVDNWYHAICDIGGQLLPSLLVPSQFYRCG